MKVIILPSYLQEVVNSSQLTGKEREDLEKELLSHHVMAIKDLKQTGAGDEDFENHLSEQFGNGKDIAMQIKKVHWKWVLVKKIIFYYSLVVVFGGPGLVVLFSSMSLFFFVFIIVSLLFGIGIYFAQSFIFDQDVIDARVSSFAIVSLAVIVQWATLFLSERKLLDYNGWGGPMSVAGFPFRLLYFPFPALGSDYVPISMWSNFYINYGFWMLVVLVMYPLIPVRFKTKKIQKLLLIVASVVSVLSCCYLLLKFD